MRKGQRHKPDLDGFSHNRNTTDILLGWPEPGGAAAAPNKLLNCGWHQWAGEALGHNTARKVGPGLDPDCG